jgi:hypothetical protein
MIDEKYFQMSVK